MTSPYETARAGVLTSIIRTVVPLTVAFVVSIFARANMTLDDGTVNALAELSGTLVATVYYAAVRLLETKVSPAWGWLLLRAKAPEYVDATAVERIQ